MDISLRNKKEIKMKNVYKIPNVGFLFILFMFFGGEDNSHASLLKIFNKSKKPTEINITFPSEGTPYCRKCLLSPQQMCGQESVKINVPLNAFRGCEYFSIIDVSNGLLGSGKCKNLSILKNYEISFIETFLGTRCQSKEI